MKRARVMAIVVTFLLLGWLGVSLALNREPRYEGRSLTDWLVDYDRTFMSALQIGYDDGPAASAVFTASTNALRHIGTNAIPFLLKKMAMNNGDKDRLNRLLKQSWIKFRFADQVSLSESGFKILGTNAAMAIPALVKIAKHPDPVVRSSALFSLHYAGAKRELLLPLLLESIHNHQVPLNGDAYLLNKLYPEEAKQAGVYQAPFTNLLDSVSLPAPKVSPPSNSAWLQTR
jgi:hypothetical protein